MQEETQLTVDTKEGTLEEETVQKPTKPSRRSILSTIASALSMGNISTHDAQIIRSNMGITQAFFTRKQPSAAQRKARRKMQRNSRRANRGNGRGQKKSGRV